MARAMLTLPVQAISTRLTENDIRALSDMIPCSECGRSMHKDALTCGNYCANDDWPLVETAEETTLRVGIDMRPRGAHAHAFA